MKWELDSFTSSSFLIVINLRSETFKNTFWAEAESAETIYFLNISLRDSTINLKFKIIYQQNKMRTSLSTHFSPLVRTLQTGTI